MGFLITSTGTTPNMIFPEWGNRTFVHPITNYNVGLEFDIDEIRQSTSLQGFLDDGSITAIYDDVPIVSSTELYNATKPSASIQFGTFGISIDGSNSVIIPGIKKQYIVFPYNCNIIAWSLISDNPLGSIVIDVWKDTTIPTVLDSITGSGKPTLSTQQINNGTVTTWTTTSISVNDIIIFNVDSVSLVTAATLLITVQKT